MSIQAKKTNTPRKKQKTALRILNLKMSTKGGPFLRLAS